MQIKHKITQADMEKHVVLCRWFCDKGDENAGRFVVLGWSTFPPLRTCDLKKQHLLGLNSSRRLSTTSIMYSLGCHMKTWNRWAVLVRRQKWTVTHGQLSVIHWSVTEVFNNIGTTKKFWEGWSIISAGWCYPSPFK